MNGCGSSALKGQPSSRPLSRVHAEDCGTRHVTRDTTNPLYVKIWTELWLEDTAKITMRFISFHENHHDVAFILLVQQMKLISCILLFEFEC